MDIKWIDVKNSMRLNRNGDVLYLTWPAFDALKWLKNGFSTRFGGVSEGIYATMNLGFGCGDDKEKVRENFARIARAIGFNEENCVLSHQTHTANVRRVGREDAGRGITRSLGWTDVDGLITDEPDIVLTTFYADCVPLYFVDPEHRAIGLSHSGWRGTAKGMARVTIEAMQREFGSDPAKMLAAIGPSVCKDCYEVSEDVALQFNNCYYVPKGKGKYLLDLHGANRGLIIDAGIPKEQVFLPNLCTNCNPDLLFSHRATGGKRGSLAAFLTITEASEVRQTIDALREAQKRFSPDGIS